MASFAWVGWYIVNLYMVSLSFWTLEDLESSRLLVLLLWDEFEDGIGIRFEVASYYVTFYFFFLPRGGATIDTCLEWEGVGTFDGWFVI